MKALLVLLGPVFFSVSIVGTASAQTRSFGAEALVIDNGAGQTITIQTPASGWTGNIPFVIPIPPAGSPSSGFTYAGTVAGQILTWVAPNTTGPAPNNYAGGVQGSWQPTTFSALGAITGTGTNGFVPLWNGASTQTNSSIADNGSTVSVTNGESLLFSGTSGSTPASGAGTRLEWIPAKAAFRAGYVDAAEWDDANVGLYSIAMGNFPLASGNSSTALGFGTQATGDYSTALGNSTIASGGTSTAMGYGTTASGQYSTAVGSYASTNGYSGTFIYGDGSTFFYATGANQFDVMATGGVNFYTELDRLTGVSFPANGGLTVRGGNVTLTSLAAGTPQNYLALDASDHVVLGSGSVVTGSGTNGLIPLWTGTSTQGNSALAQNYKNSTTPYSATSSGEQLLATDAAATDISIALQPKGAGALEAQIADGAATGGNLRGTNAVDWQMARGAATEVASGTHATGGGGFGNTASGDEGTVGGGGYNTASYYYATVGGGFSNTASADYTTISGGYSNTASGAYATVSGGASNTASGYYTTISGGYSNTASNYEATVSGGASNTASGTAATVSGGYSNTASGGEATVSGGLQAVASQYGQHAQASGDFASQGDAQTSVFTVRNSTTDGTTPTDLFLDGGSTSISVPSNEAMNFHINIIGKQSASANMAAWDLTGAVVNNGGTLTLVIFTPTLITNTVGAGTPSVTTSGTNLIIQVTGAASTNIRWVARVETTEVTY